MSMTSEIYRDITETCDILLGLLKDFEAENDAPEGRMIYQCRWLKEQAAANTLALPAEDFVHTLNYVSAEKLLSQLASSDENYRGEIGIYLYRLGYLVEKNLLLKPTYYPYALRMIEALINLLRYAPRALGQYEQGLIGELETLKQLLAEGKIEPPLMSYLPEYPNFREVRSFAGNSIDDLPDGKYLCETVANLLFEGIRPDTWRTPEDADRLTCNLPALHATNTNRPYLSWRLSLPTLHGRAVR